MHRFNRTTGWVINLNAVADSGSDATMQVNRVPLVLRQLAAVTSPEDFAVHRSLVVRMSDPGGRIIPVHIDL